MQPALADDEAKHSDLDEIHDPELVLNWESAVDAELWLHQDLFFWKSRHMYVYTFIVQTLNPKLVNVI